MWWNLCVTGFFVIGGVYYVVSKCYNSQVRHSTAVTSAEIKPETPTSGDDRSTIDIAQALVNAVRDMNAYGKKRQEILNKELIQARSMLEGIAKQFAITAAYEREMKALSTDGDSIYNMTTNYENKALSRSSSPTAASKDNMPKEAETKAASTKTKSDSTRSTGKSSRKRVSKGSTPDFQDAEGGSTSTEFLSEAEGDQEKFPLVDKEEIEPNEKVAKWLSTSPAANTANTKNIHSNDEIDICWANDPFRRNDAHMMGQDRITLPNSCTETSVDKIDDQLRNAARKSAPHLFKRLVLRKKSAVDASKLQSKPESGRRKSKETSKTDLGDTHAAKKNIYSELDLGNQEPVAYLPQESENAAYFPQEVENAAFLRKDPNTRETENTEFNDCCVLLPAKSGNEFIILTSDENFETHNAQKAAKSSSPSSDPTTFAKNKSPTDISRRNPLSPKSKENPTQARLLHKIDEVLGLRSTSFDKKKSHEAKFRVEDSSANISRSLSVDAATTVESMGRKLSPFDNQKDCKGKHHTKDTTSNQDGLQLAEKADLSSKTKTSNKRKDNQEKPQMEGSCSNRGRSKSPEKQDESTKTNSFQRKKDTLAKYHTKCIISNLGRPQSAQKECVFVQDNPLEKKKELQAKYQIKNITPTQDRSKSAGSDDECTKANPFDMGKKFPSKYHKKDIVPNQGRPKSAGSEFASPFERRKEYQAKLQMKDSTLNQGRAKSAGSEDSSSFEKRKELQAKYPMKDSTAKQERPKSAGRKNDYTEAPPFEKRKEFQGKYHKNDTTPNQARPKSAGIEDVRPLQKGTEFKTKHNMNDHSTSNQVRPKSAGSEGECVKPSPFEKRNELHTENAMKDSTARQERPKSSGRKNICTEASPFEKRKEFQGKYHKNDTIPNQARPKLAGSEDVGPLEKGTEFKTKHDLNDNSISNQDRPTSAGSEDARQEKIKEFQAKHHTKEIVPNQDKSKREPPFDKSKSFDLRKGYQPKLRIKGKSCSIPDQPVTADRQTRPKTGHQQASVTVSPSMNRSPNDTTRKKFLFDWDSRRYAVEDDPDDTACEPPEMLPKKSQLSLIPLSKGKLIPMPSVKSLLSAGNRVQEVQAPTTPTKPICKKQILLDKDKKTGNKDYGIGFGETDDGENSSDLGFETINADSTRSNCGYGEDPEHNLGFISLEPAISVCSGDDEIEFIDALLDEYMFPKCASDLLPKERNTRVNLHANLNLPSASPNMVSLSEVELLAYDGDNLSNDVFIVVSDRHRTKKPPSATCTEDSSDVIEVLTQGYRQLAREEAMRDQPYSSNP